jgi:hypothetical protein
MCADLEHGDATVFGAPYPVPSLAQRKTMRRPQGVIGQSTWEHNVPKNGELSHAQRVRLRPEMGNHEELGAAGVFSLSRRFSFELLLVLDHRGDLVLSRTTAANPISLLIGQTAR